MDQPNQLKALWSRTHWVLGALLSIPLFLLALWLLFSLSDLQSDQAVAAFCLVAVTLSTCTVCWKWVGMRQRTGVCPGIKHSTVCRPYFDRNRRIRFDLLPGFWLSCGAGVATLACVALSLYLLTELKADYSLMGCSLSLSPIPLYICWEIRKKEELRAVVVSCVLLLSAAHFLFNLPDFPAKLEVSLPLLGLIFSLCGRNLALKQSSQDFSSATSTICSMLVSGLTGLIYCLFRPSALLFSLDTDSFLYFAAGLALYAGFSALNYSIVHGSAAVATAISAFSLSLSTLFMAVSVPLWAQLGGLACFLLGAGGLLWDLAVPRSLQQEEKPQGTAEIDDMEGFYVPLQGGEVIS